MGYHWVISPIVVVGGVHKPLVATLADPGRAPGEDDFGNPIAKTLGHSTIYGSESWCLSLVHGVDTSGIDSEGQLEDFLGEEYEDHPRHLLQKPIDLGWTAQRMQEVGRKLTEHGAGARGITGSDPLWLPIQRLAIRLAGREIDPRQLMTRVF